MSSNTKPYLQMNQIIVTVYEEWKLSLREVTLIILIISLFSKTEKSELVI